MGFEGVPVFRPHDRERPAARAPMGLWTAGCRTTQKSGGKTSAFLRFRIPYCLVKEIILNAQSFGFASAVFIVARFDGFIHAVEKIFLRAAAHPFKGPVGEDKRCGGGRDGAPGAPRYTKRRICPFFGHSGVPVPFCPRGAAVYSIHQIKTEMRGLWNRSKRQSGGL